EEPAQQRREVSRQAAAPSHRPPGGELQQWGAAHEEPPRARFEERGGRRGSVGGVVGGGHGPGPQGRPTGSISASASGWLPSYIAKGARAASMSRSSPGRSTCASRFCWTPSTPSRRPTRLVWGT